MSQDGKPAGDTPRKVVRWSTDTIHTADHGGFVAYDDYLTLENELRAARAELSELQELTRMQMAGISVAALMNSRQSDPPLHKEHPYWTPAYQDTLDAVIREMAHREESERLLAELEACRADAQRYRWIPVSEKLPPPVYGEEGKPPTDSEDVAVKFEAGDSIYEIASYQHDMQRWVLPNMNWHEPDCDPIAWMELPE